MYAINSTPSKTLPQTQLDSHAAPNTLQHPLPDTAKQRESHAQKQAIYAHITPRGTMLYNQLHATLSPQEASAFEQHVNDSVFAYMAKYMRSEATQSAEIRAGVERIIMQHSDVLDDTMLATAITQFIQNSKRLSDDAKNRLTTLQNSLQQPLAHLDIAV